MKKIIIAMVSLFLFFFIIKFLGDTHPLIDFIRNEVSFIVVLTLASLFFGFVLFALRERERNLEWQENLRDRKREKLKEKGKEEPYESYF